MISNDQIELSICVAYIAYIREQFPNPTYLSERYLHILRIQEWQLKRRLRDLPSTLQDRQTLLHAHRETERFLLDISIGNRPDVCAEIEGILQSVAVEFFAEMQQIESQHPEMRAEFAREREAYRQQWNNYAKEHQSRLN